MSPPMPTVSSLLLASSGQGRSARMPDSETSILAWMVKCMRARPALKQLRIAPEALYVA